MRLDAFERGAFERGARFGTSRVRRVLDLDARLATVAMKPPSLRHMANAELVSRVVQRRSTDSEERDAASDLGRATTGVRAGGYQLTGADDFFPLPCRWFGRSMTHDPAIVVCLLAGAKWGGLDLDEEAETGQALGGGLEVAILQQGFGGFTSWGEVVLIGGRQDSWISRSRATVLSRACALYEYS
jgi:hypothetical protein